MISQNGISLPGLGNSISYLSEYYLYPIIIIHNIIVINYFLIMLFCTVFGMKDSDTLGSQPTNNKNIESQLMHHFLEDNFAFCLNQPSMFV